MDHSGINEEKRDIQSLKFLLLKAKEDARAKNHAQLCSIGISVSHIEPLAVLESVFDPTQIHFFMENKREEIAQAAAEAVVKSPELNGANRFQDARKWVKEWKENSVIVADDEIPYRGLIFLGGFPFAEDSRQDSGFLFIPRWHVIRKGNSYQAIANFLVDENCDIEHEAKQVWTLYEKFLSYKYPSLLVEETESAALSRKREFGEQMEYKRWVEEARRLIETSCVEKIVLARCLQLQVADFPLFGVLSRLRENFKECYTFSLGLGSGRYFLGASPERLLQVENQSLKTVAIAGTAGRGASLSTDAQLSSGLLKSSKDANEHSFVIESIRKRLSKLGISINAQKKPGLLQLSNVQHLQTLIEAELGDADLLDVLEQLHPTAAVGGIPKEEAIQAIASIENWDRGFYAGPIGWLNCEGDGEFVVGIRSLLVEKDHLSVYAGAGIVKESDPDKEFEETEMKFRAILETLGVGNE